jgi:hypothetical protein
LLPGNGKRKKDIRGKRRDERKSTNVGAHETIPPVRAELQPTT